jgi:hypothetical protein
VTDGDGAFKGPCNFTPQGGGSYELTAIDKRQNLVDSLEAVVVWVGKQAKLGPNEALYAYVPRGGTGHNGSMLRRSTSKPACWIGDSGHICVY